MLWLLGQTIVVVDCRKTALCAVIGTVLHFLFRMAWIVCLEGINKLFCISSPIKFFNFYVKWLIITFDLVARFATLTVLSWVSVNDLLVGFLNKMDKIQVLDNYSLHRLLFLGYFAKRMIRYFLLNTPTLDFKGLLINLHVVFFLKLSLRSFNVFCAYPSE